MAVGICNVAGAAEVVGVVEVEVALFLRFSVGVTVAGSGVVGVGGGLVHDGGTGGAAVGTPVGVLGPAGGDGVVAKSLSLHKEVDFNDARIIHSAKCLPYYYQCWYILQNKKSHNYHIFFWYSEYHMQNQKQLLNHLCENQEVLA